MREAPSVGQYIKQYDKQSGKHCGNKYVATTTMFFKCTVNKHCDNSTVFLSENHIIFVQEVKYLGALLHFSISTSNDVSRRTRKIYAKASMLL